MDAKNYAVVELSDGRISSITLDKYLASKMKIIEECEGTKIKDKVAYWDKIYHHKPLDPSTEESPNVHFYNKIRNQHFWTYKTKKSDIRGLRHKREFELVSDP